MTQLPVFILSFSLSLSLCCVRNKWLLSKMEALSPCGNSPKSSSRTPEVVVSIYRRLPISFTDVIRTSWRWLLQDKFYPEFELELRSTRIVLKASMSVWSVFLISTVYSESWEAAQASSSRGVPDLHLALRHRKDLSTHSKICCFFPHRCCSLVFLTTWSIWIGNFELWCFKAQFICQV